MFYFLVNNLTGAPAAAITEVVANVSSTDVSVDIQLQLKRGLQTGLECWEVFPNPPIQSRIAGSQ